MNEGLKKVLILSYFFPPCNMTPSQRTLAFAKYMHEFGYKPVIVTRRWDHKVNNRIDAARPTEKEMEYKDYGSYEVYYLPHIPNLRDRLYVKYGESKYTFLRRILTLFELVTQPFSDYLVTAGNLYRFSKKLLKQDPAIKHMLVTGNPFILYKYGYKLSKQFNLKWVADYRDAWTTSTIVYIGVGFVERMIRKLDQRHEKKWVGSASLVTATSEPIAKSISELVGVKSEALYNGFIESDFDEVINEKPFEKFTIAYIGTLYNEQKVEVFIEAYKKFVDTKQIPSERIQLMFVGTAFLKAQHERIKKALQGYEAYYECTPRIERKKILEIEKKAHILLHVAWQGFKGIIASKIYEYIASRSFILITPSDKSAIEDIIKTSGCGTVTNTVDETINRLEDVYNDFLNGYKRQNDISASAVQQYSRKFQTGKLASLLDKL